MPVITRGTTISRTLALDITITDTGEGDAYCAGTITQLGQTARWTALFQTISSVRKCTLTLNGVSKGQFTVSAGTYTGTIVIEAECEQLVSLPYPLGIRADFYERLAIGGTHTSTIDLLGYSQTTTTTAAGIGFVGGLSSLTVDTSGYVGTSLTPKGATLTCEVAFTGLPAPIDRPTLTHSESGTVTVPGARTYTYDVESESSETRTWFSIERSNATHPISGLPANGAPWSASAYLVATPVRTATVDVRVARCEDAIANAGVITLTDVAPITFTGTHQEVVTRSSGSNSISHSSNVVFSGTYQSGLTTSPPSRLTASLMLAETVGRVGPVGLPIAGWAWDAIELTHLNPARIDEGGTLTPTNPNASLPTGAFDGSWSAASGGSVSTAGGMITLTGSAGKTMTRAFTSRDASSMLAWQRLRIRMRCTAASHTIRVRVNQDTTTAANAQQNKHWDVATGAANTWATLDIDTAAEQNGPVIAESEFTGNYAGIYATQLIFESLGAGTYDIDWIDLDCPEDVVVHVNFAQGAQLYANTAGVCTLLIKAVNDVTGTTIDDVVDKVNDTDDLLRPVGWSANTLNPYASEGAEPWALAKIQMDNQPARLLANLLYENNAWGAQFGPSGVAVGDPIRAQFKVFALGWDWPETDMFDLGGDPGDGQYLGVGYLYGGGFWGRVLDSARAPQSGSVVEARRDPGAVVIGDDTTDALGVYATDAPHAGVEPTLSSVYAALVGSSPLLRTYRNGAPPGRTRVTFADTSPTGTGDSISLTCSPTGRLTRAFADSGQVIVETRDNDDQATWTRVASGISGARPCVRYDWQGTRSYLLLAYEDGSNIRLTYSEDEGRTWAVATTITSDGKHPDICIDQTGKRHFFYFRNVSGVGKIFTQIRDVAANVLVAETAAVSTGVADDSLAAVEDIDTQKIALVYASTGGAIILVESSDGGITFS